MLFFGSCVEPKLKATLTPLPCSRAISASSCERVFTLAMRARSPAIGRAPSFWTAALSVQEA